MTSDASDASDDRSAPDAVARARLLHELRAESYVMLRPSPIEGVGVFALVDIPEGCRAIFSPPDRPDDWVTLARADVDALPPHARQLVENYCLFDAAQYWVPAAGFKRMDLACFLNHSDEPNVRSIDGGNWFEAMRPIAAGEELTIDYGEIVEGEE